MDGALTAERVDEALDRMEMELRAVHASQGSIVKLPKAELELLQTLEFLRDFIMACLRSTADRKVFFSIFGGDCKRVSRIEAVLSGLELSDMNKDDQRLKFCKSACESAEQVLLDLGLGATLAEAIDREKEVLATWSSPKAPPSAVDFDMSAAVAGEEGAASKADVSEELEGSADPAGAAFDPPPRIPSMPEAEAEVSTAPDETKSSQADPAAAGPAERDDQRDTDSEEDAEGAEDLCRRYVILVATAEQKAVEADREGQTRLALEAWRECAKYLELAIRHSLPKHASDKPKLEEHLEQVKARIAHLEDVVLNGVPTKPVEEHIGEVKLNIGMEEAEVESGTGMEAQASGSTDQGKGDKRKKVVAACAAMGAVGGAVLLGPVGLSVACVAGAVGAAGGAFAATRENAVGEGARKVGGKAVDASEQTAGKLKDSSSAAAERLKDKAEPLTGKMTKTFSDRKSQVVDKGQKLRSDLFEKAAAMKKNFGKKSADGSDGKKT
mmetsp:Transcript_31348/g.73114  ORF Transcript_31348/g.73114 Transcript_31348/m.73114 type:complete len:498 (+) Transcript_31348:63-1556(+)